MFSRDTGEITKLAGLAAVNRLNLPAAGVGKERREMDRHAKFVWMKEVLERLGDCQREWETAEGATERFLADSIKRDLDEVRRICDSLRQDSPVYQRRRVAC